MNDLAKQRIIDRVERELLDGTYFSRIARSLRSVTGGGVPIQSRYWAGIMQAIARYAGGGDRSAATAARVFASNATNPYLTVNEIVAYVASALADVAHDGYQDVIGATGPEAGRPSSHQHATDLNEALNLALLMSEVEFSAGAIGYLPGLGWVVADLLRREGKTIPAHLFPRTAAAQAKRL